MDIFSISKRSLFFLCITSVNTNPVKAVRSFLHRAGFRFGLHSKAVVGKPDIYLSKFKTAVFVHGCYWHRHSGCAKGRSTPASNKKFWLSKFEGNVKRDKKVRRLLRKAGISAIIVWECEVRKEATLRKRLKPLLDKKLSGL